MKTAWLRICIAIFVVLCTSVASAVEVLAWGPITHQKIVEDAAYETPSYEAERLWSDYPEYVYGGAIAPDWCVAYGRTRRWASDGNEVMLHQGEFHSTEFMDAMRNLIATDEEKAFYYGYQSHVISDDYEAELGNTVNPEPDDYAREFYVDKLIVAGGYVGKIDVAICSDLMVEAYRIAFPGSKWQPPFSKIDSLYAANWIYQRLWLPFLSGISVQKGSYYYVDYEAFVIESIRATRDRGFSLSVASVLSPTQDSQLSSK